MSRVFEAVTLLVLLSVYLTPAIEADARGHEDAVTITLVNVFLGWTLIGWAASLWWARHPFGASRISHVAGNAQRAIARTTIERIVARARARGHGRDVAQAGGARKGASGHSWAGGRDAATGRC